MKNLLGFNLGMTVAGLSCALCAITAGEGITNDIAMYGSLGIFSFLSLINILFMTDPEL